MYRLGFLGYLDSLCSRGSNGNANYVVVSLSSRVAVSCLARSCRGISEMEGKYEAHLVL